MPLLSDVVGIFFQRNRNVNSGWAIFGLCYYCIQWAISPLWRDVAPSSLTDPLCGAGLYTVEHVRTWRFGGRGALFAVGVFNAVKLKRFWRRSYRTENTASAWERVITECCLREWWLFVVRDVGHTLRVRRFGSSVGEDSGLYVVAEWYPTFRWNDSHSSSSLYSCYRAS